MEYILRTNKISKKYKKQFVLKDVSMNIKKGDIYGFVGENGSGKTTIIRIITGLIFPTRGSFELFGIKNNDPNILKAKKKLGAIVENPSIYLNMTAYENLKTQAMILGMNDENKIKSVLNDVGLDYLYDSPKKATTFSLGMRQRLGIAMALLGDVEFLLLDEPMNGLDPTGIVEVRELILKLNKEKNITILISSHILTELSLVATKYGIISKGRLLTEISNEDLKLECRGYIEFVTNDIAKTSEIILKYHSSEHIEILENSIKIFENVDFNKLLKDIIDNNIEIININSKETNIEDYYLSTIGGAHA